MWHMHEALHAHGIKKLPGRVLQVYQAGNITIVEANLEQ